MQTHSLALLFAGVVGLGAACHRRGVVAEARPGSAAPERETVPAVRATAVESTRDWCVESEGEILDIALDRSLCALYRGGHVACTSGREQRLRWLPDVSNVRAIEVLRSGDIGFVHVDGRLTRRGDPKGAHPETRGPIEIFGEMHPASEQPEIIPPRLRRRFEPKWQAKNHDMHCVLSEDGAVACVSQVHGARMAGDPLALPRIAEIAAGSGFACARAEDGRVFCWGDNDRGALGDSTDITRARPDVLPAVRAAQLVADDRRACVIGLDRMVSCWGQVGGTLHDFAPNPVYGPCDTPATRRPSTTARIDEIRDDRFVPHIEKTRRLPASAAVERCAMLLRGASDRLGREGMCAGACATLDEMRSVCADLERDAKLPSIAESDARRCLTDLRRDAWPGRVEKAFREGAVPHISPRCDALRVFALCREHDDCTPLQALLCASG